MTHTPMPWKIDPSWDILGNTSAGNGIICEVVHGDFFAPGEAEANARLIAQAPAMLALLKKFPGFTDDATVGDAWADKVRAVIKEVEGK